MSNMATLINRLNIPFLNVFNAQTALIRNASKKTGTSTRNPTRHRRPKHRGVKVQDGHWVEAGTMLATQRKLRFHPGLNAGLGRDLTIFAITPGRVMVTCEKPDLNWDHNFVKMFYEGRNEEGLRKKYFNVIPEKQHQNFKLIEQI